MKGIILAGGTGSRLFPITLGCNKQLLPVYDKPMIFYPLSVLMLAGIREILLISSPEQLPRYEALLGHGEQWGLELRYVAQPSPDGLAQAFILGAEFLAGEPATLILGDNIFYGHGLPEAVCRGVVKKAGAHVFAYWVEDPRPYGVITFDAQDRPVEIVEKPQDPTSHWAVVGLYCYDGSVTDRARRLKPSARGELEITDLNRSYLQEGLLQVERLGRGYAWFDTGTHDSLLEASEFVRTVQKRQGLHVCNPDEIAFRMGFIDRQQLERTAIRFGKTDYGRYLHRILSGEADSLGFGVAPARPGQGG